MGEMELVYVCSWCCMVKLVMMSASPSHTTVFRHVFPCLAVSSHEKHATKLQTWLEIGHAHPKRILSRRIARASHPIIPRSHTTPCAPPPPQGYSYPSDIWSIGVTILEVAAGKYPFKARGPFDLFEEICSDKPPVDCLPPGKFSEDFIDFVTCMLRRVSASVDGWSSFAAPTLMTKDGLKPRVLVPSSMERRGVGVGVYGCDFAQSSFAYVFVRGARVLHGWHMGSPERVG